MSNILVFCPEAGLVPHLAATLLVARTLQDLGHEVYCVYCDGRLSRCVMMDSRSVSPDVGADERRKICDFCAKICQAGVSRFGVKAIQLGSLGRQEYDNDQPFNIKFVHDGVNLGKMGAQSVTFAKKVSDFDVIETTYRDLLEDSIKGCRDAYDVVKEITSRVKIDKIICHSAYGYNISAAAAGWKTGIKTVFMTNVNHNGVDRRYMTFESTPQRAVARNLIAEWLEWRNIPLSPTAVDTSFEDVVSRFAGTSIHIYSPGKTMAGDLRSQLGIPEGVSVTSVFTSSLDELVAQELVADAFDLPPEIGENDIFPDQITWLKETIEWYGSRRDAFLIIRIHPREGANRRENVSSQHLVKLQEALVSLPANVMVVWPQDNVSSYDLMEISNLVMISYSSIGLEASRMGIPVISAFKSNYVYPHDVFIQHPDDKNEYFGLIYCMLRDHNPPDIEQILLSQRWYDLSRFGHSVYVGDVIPDANFETFPDYTLPAAAEEMAAHILGEERVEQRRLREKSQWTGKDCAAELERTLFRLRQVVHYLMTGLLREDDFFLSVGQNLNLPADIRPDEFFLDIDGDHCRFVGCDIDVKRFSPMIRRIALLSAQRRR